MSDVYVIRNQLGHYWGKAKAWVDGTEARAVMRLRHEDEAINTLFELSSKDVELRGEVSPVALDERGEVVVEPSAHLIVQPGPADADSDAAGNSTPDSETQAQVASNEA